MEACPGLTTPATSDQPRIYRSSECCLPLNRRRRRRDHTRCRSSTLAACFLAVYASHPPVARREATLATGLPARLWPGRTFTGWTSLRGFTDSSRILLSRAFPSATVLRLILSKLTRVSPPPSPPELHILFTAHPRDAIVATCSLARHGFPTRSIVPEGTAPRMTWGKI